MPHLTARAVDRNSDTVSGHTGVCVGTKVAIVAKYGERLLFAGARADIANAIVALVVECGAINGQSSAHPAGACIVDGA